MWAMAAKSMKKRVEEAFDPEGADAAFCEKYLDLLYANWAAIATSLRRTATLVIVLMLGFVLLTQSRDAQFTLGPLKFTNVASVLVVAPALVSFLMFELYSLVLASRLYREATNAVMRRLHPSVQANHLNLLLAPPTASLWADNGWTSLQVSHSDFLSKIFEWTMLVAALTILMGTGFFLIYAYVTLYEGGRANSVAVTASAVFACFNVFRAGLLVRF
jgi:hypothetical protein